MKRLLVVAAGLGLVLAVAIIAYEGFGAVTHALAAVGFGLIVVTRAARGSSRQRGARVRGVISP